MVGVVVRMHHVMRGDSPFLAEEEVVIAWMIRKWDKQIMGKEYYDEGSRRGSTLSLSVALLLKIAPSVLCWFGASSFSFSPAIDI